MEFQNQSARHGLEMAFATEKESGPIRGANLVFTAWRAPRGRRRFGEFFSSHQRDARSRGSVTRRFDPTLFCGELTKGRCTRVCASSAVSSGNGTRSEDARTDGRVERGFGRGVRGALRARRGIRGGRGMAGVESVSGGAHHPPDRARVHHPARATIVSSPLALTRVPRPAAARPARARVPLPRRRVNRGGGRCADPPRSSRTASCRVCSPSPTSAASTRCTAASSSPSVTPGARRLTDSRSTPATSSEDASRSRACSSRSSGPDARARLVP